jgi:hypothetical protein
MQQQSARGTVIRSKHSGSFEYFSQTDATLWQFRAISGKTTQEETDLFVIFLCKNHIFCNTKQCTSNRTTPWFFAFFTDLFPRKCATQSSMSL